MRNTVNILGVNVDNINMDNAIKKIIEFTNDDTPKMVFTPNPEFIMTAQEDEEFKKILNSADLVIPDGIGVVLASKILGKSISGRVTGFDTMSNLFKVSSDGSLSFYFFGSKPGIAELAEEKLKSIYPNLNIVGTRNGYFKEEDEKEIIDGINAVNPDILFVGLGAPKQEKWIFKNKEKLNVKVLIGIGGALDGFAGTVKRAPVIFQKLGLEWFYRLLKQPSRFFRMLKLPQFALIVIWSKIKTLILGPSPTSREGRKTDK